MALIGSLYIVATPIGNMADITIRALETLKTVDLIVAEDTREIAKVLQKFQISKSSISYRDQNHDEVYPRIIDELAKGHNVALVSDSGTPLISDPGYKLVNALIKENYKVVSIPGPSAVIAALSVSGIPTDKFLFLGFLPKKSEDRIAELIRYKDIDATLVVYESPLRLKELLLDLKEALGNRVVCIAKDLTKAFESVNTQRLTVHINNLQEAEPKGEYVIVVSKADFSL